MRHSEKVYLRSYGIKTSQYRKYEDGTLLTPRMEEVLLKFRREDDWCQKYPFFVVTLKCLIKRGLVKAVIPTLKNGDMSNPFKLTTKGKKIVKELMIK